MKAIGKRILLLVAACCLMAAAHAQTSKDINKIKRSSAYLYSEATMADAKEAADVAYELLMRQVEEYIASKRKLSQADNVLIKDIRTRGEQISMMRGEMHRVFVYVKKSDIEGVENTTVVNNATGATVSINSQPGSASSQPPAVSPQPTVVSQPAPEQVPTVQVPAEEVAVDEAEDHIFADEFQPEDEATQTRLATVGGAYLDQSKVQSTLPAWQQQAIADMLDCADLAAVRAKLSRLKAQYKVKRFGSADRCSNAAEACWAIFDPAGKLITILGPGAQSRIDYRTMQETTLDAYKGMNALWFNFAK